MCQAFFLLPKNRIMESMDPAVEIQKGNCCLNV